MDLHTALVTILAFSAVISVLGFIFHLLLNPVKDNQAKMEKNQTKMENDIKEVRKEIKQIETKVDQIISVLKTAYQKNPF